MRNAQRGFGVFEKGVEEVTEIINSKKFVEHLIPCTICSRNWNKMCPLGKHLLKEMYNGRSHREIQDHMIDLCIRLSK